MKGTATLLLLGLPLTMGCLARKTPDHLKPDVPESHGPQSTPPASLDEAVAQLTRGDPLLRRPNARTEEWWLATGGGASIAAWREALGTGRIDTAALASLEGSWRGSLAVPLSRGARLAELENQLLRQVDGLEEDRSLLTCLGSVIVTGPAGPSDVRPALDWLDSSQGRPALLRVAERSVMLGWLDSPQIPLAPVEAAMTIGTFDRLRAIPAGQLVVARAQGDAPEPGALAEGTSLLHDATQLALIRVAADSAGQQEAARRAADAVKAQRELDLTDAQDPVPYLLEQSFAQLVGAGGTVDATGLGLVALTASRLLDACPDRPCAGLDQHDTLSRAAAWTPEAETAAWAWRLIAAKDLRDRLEVAEERGLSTDALPGVADLIVGERAARVPIALLQQSSLGPSAALAITRGLGQPDGTQAEEALSALDAHIDHLCAERPAELIEAWEPPVRKLCESD